MPRRTWAWRADTVLHAASAAPAVAAAWRLKGARACAWALLMSGWLTLGELGAASWPQTAGGVVPLSLWLLAIGAGLGLARRHPPGAAALRAGLLGAGALATVWLTVMPSGRVGLSVLALAWAALLVLASLSVRALRGGASGAPILPACAGAALAWATHAAAGSAWLVNLDLAAPWRLGELSATPAQAGAAPLLTLCTLLLVALVPAQVKPPGACRAGLFDCSLPLVGHAPGAWRWPVVQNWPGLAAGLVMLPMMASLPAMAPWCAGPGGIGMGGVTVGAGVAADLLAGPALAGLHLAAMLLPGAVLALWCSGRPGRLPGAGRLAATIALQMLAGVCLWMVMPPAFGLLLLGLCHGVAWSLAWAGSIVKRDDGRAAPSAAGAGLARAAGTSGRQAGLARGAQAAVGLLLAPVLVLGLGSAMARWGAPAVVGVHVALTVWALAGLWLTIALDLLRADPVPPQQTLADAPIDAAVRWPTV